MCLDNNLSEKLLNKHVWMCLLINYFYNQRLMRVNMSKLCINWFYKLSWEIWENKLKMAYEYFINYLYKLFKMFFIVTNIVFDLRKKMK